MTSLKIKSWTGFDQPHLIAQAWSLRHEVFRSQLGWQVQSLNNLEYDRFDSWASHCCALDDEKVVAYWRALPTLKPYLLEESFQSLLHGKPLPRHADIWEISRFLVSPTHPDRDDVGRMMVREAGFFGATAGASTLLAVVEPPFARFIRASGLPIRNECAPTPVGSGSRGIVKAVLISLNVQALMDSIPDMQARAA